MPALNVKYGAWPKHGDTETILMTTHAQKLPEKSNSSHFVSPLMKEYRKYAKTDYKVTYDGVNPNIKNVWISLNKMFNRPKLSYDKKILWGRVMSLMMRVIGPHMKRGLQWDPTITEDSVPGVPWKYFGFKTKEEVLNHPMFAESHKQCRSGEKKYPPFVSAGKRELLTKEEILEGKIRTFLMAPLELLLDEKWLYGEQDEAMKEMNPSFIRYGINFHEGGFDRMIKRMISDFYIEYDVKGWDRQLPILDFVMEFRNRCLRQAVGPEIWEEIKGTVARVTEAVVNHELLLPDGSVVRFNWGQMSGDGMTTSNNCLAHNALIFYLLIKANPKASDDEIVSQRANIYGDDQLGGFSNIFMKLREEAFVDSVYKEFGLSVKEGTWKCQETPEGMTFLGATVRSFRAKHQIWFAPSYKRERVLSGLYISVDPLNADEELMKAFSLLELGWFDCYDDIAAYIEFLFRRAPGSSIKDAFVAMGIPSREYLRNKWAGLYGSR